MSKTITLRNFAGDYYSIECPERDDLGDKVRVIYTYVYKKRDFFGNYVYVLDSYEMK